MAAALAPLPLAEALAGRAGRAARRRPAAPASTWSRTGRLVGALRPAGRRPPGPAAAPPTTCSASAGRSTTLVGATIRTTGRHRARPRHRLRRPGPAPVHARPVGHRHRPVRAGAALRRDHRRAQRAATGSCSRGDLVAPVAGRRFDLVVSNPPFVVGPGTDHAHLPRLRPGRRRRRRRAGRRRTGPADRGRHDAVPGELGARRRRGLGRAGRRLVRRHRPGRLGDPARGGRPDGVRRPVAAPTPARPPTRTGRRPGWTGSTRRRSRRSASAWSPCAAAATTDPVVRVEDLRQAVQPPLGDAGRGLVRPPGLAPGTRRRRTARGALPGRRRAAAAPGGHHGRRGLGRRPAGARDAARAALVRGGRSAGAGAGRRRRRSACRCATSSRCSPPRTTCPSPTLAEAAGPIVGAPGRARPDRSGRADRRCGRWCRP